MSCSMQAGSSSDEAQQAAHTLSPSTQTHGQGQQAAHGTLSASPLIAVPGCMFMPATHRQLGGHHGCIHDSGRGGGLPAEGHWPSAWQAIAAYLVTTKNDMVLVLFEELHVCPAVSHPVALDLLHAVGGVNLHFTQQVGKKAQPEATAAQHHEHTAGNSLDARLCSHSDLCAVGCKNAVDWCHQLGVFGPGHTFNKIDLCYIDCCCLVSHISKPWW